MSGPAVVHLPADPFRYTVTFTYLGPPRTSRVETRFIERFPLALILTTPVFPSSDGVGVSDCSNTYGPTQPDGAPGAITLSCATSIDRTRTVSLTVQVRAYPTRPGVQTNVFELENGDSASWTTEFIRDEAPPPVPPPAALTWSDPDASFDVTGVRLTSSRTSLAAVEKPTRGTLKITKIRKTRALDVRIKNVKRDKLTFEIVAKKLDGPTRVVAKIRQSKR